MKKISILTLAVLPLLLTSCTGERYTSKEQYKDCLDKAIANSDFHSELYIFPKEVKQECITDFIYKTKDSLFNGSYYFYLVCEYTQAEFDAELTRIASIKATFTKDNKEKSIIKFEDKSMYLTIDKDSRYEYVKYDTSKLEIAYVSNQLFEWTNVEIDNNHRMGNVKIPKELDDGNGSYNMYYSYENGVGYYVND